MGFLDFLLKTEKNKKTGNSEKPINVKKIDESGIKKFYPSSFDDVSTIIDYLSMKNPAIVYLTELSDKTAQRVIDLLSGATYALNGKIAPLDTSVYLLTI